MSKTDRKAPEPKRRRKNFHTNAARAIASIVGALAGLGGLTHGIGEVLQGNIAPSGFAINSWTTGPIATSMGGDPGMTIVPNLLLTGILCIIVSLIAIVWALVLVNRKNGGIILVSLSIAMLLVGGGFAPPILCVLAGIAGMGINARHNLWEKYVPGNVRRALAGSWPLVFGICVANGVFLVIGSYILVFFLGFNMPEVFVYSFFFAILLVILSAITGVAYDISAGRQGTVKNIPS
jgi:hypothetical protein